MTWRTTISTIIAATICTSLHAQSYRNQDAAVGGIAGAVIGGIIGHQNDETPEGALIGGAVGAIAGGLLGNAKDQEVARHRYYQHQAYRQHQQALGRAVTIQDVVSMSRSGLGESVIINQIRQNGVLDHVGTHEIISMHNQGGERARYFGHAGGTASCGTSSQRTATSDGHRGTPCTTQKSDRPQRIRRTTTRSLCNASCIPNLSLATQISSLLVGSLGQICRCRERIALTRK